MYDHNTAISFYIIPLSDHEQKFIKDKEMDSKRVPPAAGDHAAHLRFLFETTAAIDPQTFSHSTALGDYNLIVYNLNPDAEERLKCSRF